MKRPKFIACLVLIALSVAGGTATALATDQDVRKILAPTGTLRAGLYPGTPTSILPDGPDGPRGVGYDLGKEFAKRLGVPYEPVVFSKNAEVLAAVRTGRVDVVFTNASAARAEDMLFGPPYLEIELGYLVRKASPVTTLSEVDLLGRRIGVIEGSTSDATLSRELKNAVVVRAPTIRAGIEMLSTGSIDAFATNKATLFEMAEKLPGSKVLDGQWGIDRHAMAIPKGREQGLPFLHKFTEDIKAEGLATAAIARAGLRGATPLK